MQASVGTGGGQRRLVKQRVGPKLECAWCGTRIWRVQGCPAFSTEFCAYAQCRLHGEQLQQLLGQQQQRQEQQLQVLTQLQQRHQRELADWDTNAQEQE